VFTPLDLPDGVGMLVGTYSGLVDGFGDFVADVVDHDGAVITADAQERRIFHVEVDAHHARLCYELLLGELVVLYGVAQDCARALFLLVL
jgi:hypothetical protein